MRKFFRIVVLIILSEAVDGQSYYISTSFRPYLYDIGGHSFSNKGDIGIKNIDFNISKTLGDIYLISLTYCRGDFNVIESRYSYTLKSNTFKIALGQYTNLTRGNKRHFYGWHAGVNISPTDYFLKFTLTDPMGTTYLEEYEKKKWNFGIELSEYFFYNITGPVYLKGVISTNLSPNFDNPFDDDPVKGFTKLADYSPAGGIWPLFNVLCSLGIAVRIN